MKNRTIEISFFLKIERKTIEKIHFLRYNLQKYVKVLQSAFLLYTESTNPPI